jgi:hypothetical protein
MRKMRVYMVSPSRRERSEHAGRDEQGLSLLREAFVANSGTSSRCQAG